MRYAVADEPEPTEWNPDHPLLKSPLAPHEVSGVLRMDRGGWPAAIILKTVGTNGSKLMQAFLKGRRDEEQAKQQGRDIHEARPPKGTE